MIVFDYLSCLNSLGVSPVSVVRPNGKKSFNLAMPRLKVLLRFLTCLYILISFWSGPPYN